MADAYSRRWMLGALGLGGVVAAGYALGGRELYWQVAAGPSADRQLSARQAHAQAVAGDLLLIDIRRPEEWAASGIGEGALGLDMRRDDFIKELSRLTGGDRQASVALICARGVRSARLTARLSEAGFEQIIDVPEGMLGSAAGPGWVAQAYRWSGADEETRAGCSSVADRVARLVPSPLRGGG